eukprot:gnl/MRDRNA2_/MRDRNA2_27111_c0_seq1.p1 gnl/MRDRNA2_/MRDRNA2_27111_c0~~gnl/MRDRNA2_/MRDRNA2_27111_c0_seq1.p1  ORF type:complete len:378 (-),score=81.89 gnl/MRDRNA2_/MRDRNA2_27111_c0_seq1:93-1226(-)
MASIKAIQEQERLRKEARRAAVADQAKVEAEARAAEAARKRNREELYGKILRAIEEGREDDAVNLIQRDRESDADLLCTTDHTKCTVLHRAAASNQLKCCQAILRHEDFDDLHVIIDAKDSSGCTPLHLAARMDNGDICMHLMQAKANAAALDDRGWTAMDYANAWGLSDPSAALQEATFAAQLQAAEELRRKLAEEEAARLAAIKPPDLRARDALLLALSEKRLDDCMTVLENPEWLYTNERDFRGRNALHLAAEKGYLDICRALLARPDFRTAGVFDKDRSTALHYAVGNRCADVSLAIIESDNFNAIDAVNIRDQTALTLAAQRGDVAVCHAILKRMKPEALNIQDKNRLCALDYADDNELFEVASAIRTIMGQ